MKKLLRAYATLRNDTFEFMMIEKTDFVSLQNINFSVVYLV